MRHYPVFLRLTGRQCLVVGAGGVGWRKIAGLLECEPARVLVVDTRQPDAADPDVARLLTHPAVEYQARSFGPQDLEGMFLAIAATSNSELNQRIAGLCQERGILCNIVDQPEAGSFIVPAVHRQGELTVAVSTGGASPALARRIRKELQEHFGNHYAAFLTLMARLRPLVLALEHDSDENGKLFRQLAHSALLDALQRADRSAAEDILTHSLPAALGPHMGELLDGIC